MDSSKSHIYSIFHLNLAYSSIEEEQRPEVIEKCYWSLLNIAQRYNLPFGIEASAYTLESIESIDPSWIRELRSLTTKGSCEFIGSGYSQLIGPIAPAEVNEANLRIGNKIYQKMLGFSPDLAFIQEQAYSSGLIRHYLDAGYKGIVMEWENPCRYHNEWNSEWKYYPQYACDQYGNSIPLIWNMSIPFQKLQRYAHGEMELSDYIDYIVQHHYAPMRFFPIYGNDVEIFNFRPGRYHTEADIKYDEWERISNLFTMFQNDSRFVFIQPSEVLNSLTNPNAGNKLQLESPQQPIPVKKQGKYNISRWAVTGRNDLYMNTCCWRIYSFYLRNKYQDDDSWKELCYLWSSDFRTHITEKRWNGYMERLTKALEKSGCHQSLECNGSNDRYNETSKGVDSIVIQQNDRFITVDTESVKLKLNLRKGMAIESLWNKKISEEPIVCTIPHGYYEDIRFGADFYSGHMIIESPGQVKITDLVPVVPYIEETQDAVRVKGKLFTPLGYIYKKIIISKHTGTVELKYDFQDLQIPKGSFRLGYITLNPAFFDVKNLYYSSCNGGYKPEVFQINRKEIDLGAPVSFLVSASQGIGMTDGKLTIGDSDRSVNINVDMKCSAPIGLISYHKVDDQFFFRAGFSLGEMDETVRHECQGVWSPVFRMMIQIE